MEVYFIRHGQTICNAETIHAGWAPVELTEVGKNQAAETGNAIRNIAFDRIYVSDLVRTRQTAEIIFPGRDFVFDSRLREHNVGTLQYKKVSDCYLQYGETYRQNRMNDDFSAYNGESREEMINRVYDFMRFLERVSCEEKPPQRVAVVCHEGSIFYTLCYISGLLLPKFRFPLTNCSVSKYRFSNGVWKVDFWNWNDNID